MEILIHYTTHPSVYKKYSEDTIIQNPQLDEVINFFNTHSRHQNVVPFVVIYHNTLDHSESYCSGKIVQCESDYYFYKFEDELSYKIISSIDLHNHNTYDKEIYYKSFNLEDDNPFAAVAINEKISKIKLKYYTWEELTSENEILFSHLSNILFDVETVLIMAHTYAPTDGFTIQQKKSEFRHP